MSVGDRYRVTRSSRDSVVCHWFAVGEVVTETEYDDHPDYAPETEPVTRWVVGVEGYPQHVLVEELELLPAEGNPA